MRILFLTQTWPRFAGDTAGPFIRELARALVRGGDAVRVLVPHSAEVAASWQDDGVEVRSFRYAPQRLEVLGYSRSLVADERPRPLAALVAPAYLAAAGWAVRRAVRQAARAATPFDLVQAHWVVPNALPLAGVARRMPLAIGLHGSDVFQAERPGVRTWVGRVLGRTATLTGCSPELVDRVCTLGFPRPRAHVIPYGIDVETYRPGPPRRRAWRSEFGIPEEAPLLISVGRMVSKKGYDVLAAALPELLGRFPDLHVLLAGAGDLLEGFRRQFSRWQARVHLPGIVLRDTLPDLYRAADLFVLPAVHDRKGNVDGLPNVILEAMASGLPVVASGISGIPLAVTDGIHGRLVPERDPQSLEAALAELLADPERRRGMGAAARERAVRELTWETIAGRYRAAYAEGIVAFGQRRDGRPSGVRPGSG